MAKKKTVVADMSTYTLSELLVKLAEARREVARLRMELRMGQLKDTAKYARAKKVVAQVSTAVSAKKLSEIII